MKTNLTRRRIAQASLLSLLGFTGLAQADNTAPAPKWPDKTVRIVVAGPAGASADIIARLVADGLAKDSGPPVVVDPKPGAGGVLAVNDLSQSPHDGYTVLVGVNSLSARSRTSSRCATTWPRRSSPWPSSAAVAW